MIPMLICFPPEISRAMYLQTALEIIIELSKKKQASAIKTTLRMAGALVYIALGILLLLDHLIKMSAME